MVDLNLVFANDSMSANALLGMTPAAGSQQTYSPSFTSFSEILASTQNSSIQAQDETSSSTTLVQQFQSQQSWQNAVSDDHSNDDGSSSLSTPNSPVPVKPGPSESTTDTTSKKEDTYVAHGSKDRAQGETDRQSIKGKVDRSIEPAAGSKPVDKAKHSKNASQSSSQIDRTDNTQPEVNSASGTNPLGQAVSSLATGGTELSAQSSETAVAAARGGRKAKSGDSNGELAFAVKVQGDSGQPTDRILPSASGDSTEDPGNSSSSSPFAAELGAVLAASAGTGQTAATSSGNRALTGLSMLSVSTPQPASPDAGDSPVNNASEDAPKLAEVPEEPAMSTLPVKTVDVQITGADNQRVDLRLMEKSGTLTMSVRSVDVNLTKALQQNLPELATKLNDQEIRAEWWKPGTQSAEPAQKLEPSNTNSNNSQDQGGQNKGNSGQPGGRGTGQPDWLDELSALRKSTKNGTQLSWQL